MPNSWCRSVLYMPGSNERALEKGASLDVAGIIFDFEDAVAPEAKAIAREKTIEAFKQHDYGSRHRVIRVNEPSTEYFETDLETALMAKPHAILIPKVEDVGVLEAIARKTGDIPLWAMMESPLAMLKAEEIAASSTSIPLEAFVIGSNDLIKDTELRIHKDRTILYPFLMTCVAAAKAYGLNILDGVFNDFSDEDGFRNECFEGRSMGMDGKTLIHPKQIDICNSAFSPSDDEINEAQMIVDSFNLPENKNKGAININGRMVELLHYKTALKLLNSR